MHAKHVTSIVKSATFVMILD